MNEDNSLERYLIRSNAEREHRRELLLERIAVALEYICNNVADIATAVEKET